MKRHQIYLDEGQQDRLTDRARRRNTTVSALIRGAIDRELSEPEPEQERLMTWRAAVDETAGVADGLPDGKTFLDQVRVGERGKFADR